MALATASLCVFKNNGSSSATPHSASMPMRAARSWPACSALVITASTVGTASRIVLRTLSGSFSIVRMAAYTSTPAARTMASPSVKPVCVSSSMALRLSAMNPLRSRTSTAATDSANERSSGCLWRAYSNIIGKNSSHLRSGTSTPAYAHRQNVSLRRSGPSGSVSKHRINACFTTFSASPDARYTRQSSPFTLLKFFKYTNAVERATTSCCSSTII
mmetsp:Transcript_4878/g.7861  ORF Transcript_4878/g.7861 Transcript_4878/m.7861 type:complete len:217 (-) Transcript_4878:158-808(-)